MADLSIGFLNQQIDNRGTGNALFDYAHYNEEILGNKSYIFSRNYSPNDPQMEKRILNRFGYIYSEKSTRKLDVLYHIKSGYDDGFRAPDGVRYAVHAVFDFRPHGDRYAMVSNWLASGRVPFVPHIVGLPVSSEDLRLSLGIRPFDTVFGRHGGPDTFDIPWAWDAVLTMANNRSDVWFIFLNTNIPEFVKHPRIISLPNTADPVEKRKFINTCDAMIHARSRGETFGIAVGEFAVCNKPVITYSESPEKAHLQELGNFAYLYDDYTSLMEQIRSIIDQPALSWGYGQYTPENVMKKFDEVFLS